MIVLLAVAAWALVALTVGLITGEPFLRTGGVLVLSVFLGAAYLLDWWVCRRGWREALWLEQDWGDECGDVGWFWPEDETRRAA